VYLVGPVAGTDQLAGTITVGDLVVYTGSASVFGSPSVGSVAIVSGRYPGAGNLIVADSVSTLQLEASELYNDNLLMSISGSSGILK
jgi:hypothetical protein